MHLGEYQNLKVVKMVDFGVYLQEEDGEILLPKKQVPEGTKIGDELRVFLYKDSNDRPIATRKEVKLVKGDTALLTVAAVNRMGAFLDWGLEKDLFLPFKEQTKKVKEGEQVLVSLYIDKSKRLCATMNVYNALRCDSNYRAGDEVTGIIYEESPQYGYFVAVDNCYSAIISRQEAYGNLQIGDTVKARVIKVRDDGKLNLSVREKAYLQMYTDMEKILQLLDSYSGVLPFTEKATPEVIRRETGMGKNEFKRAVGHLYKERKIDITNGTIRRVEGKN
ncbi:MAG: S1 RNA-binding domain-containing protein [Lachnospiraceae bacterium]